MDSDITRSRENTTSPIAPSGQVAVAQSPSPVVSTGPVVDTPFNGILQPADSALTPGRSLDESSVLNQGPLNRVDMPDEPIVPPQARFSRQRLLGVGLLLLGVLAATMLGVRIEANKSKNLNESLTSASQRIKPQSTSLASLSSQLSTSAPALSTLTVNGQVNVGNSLVLQPSAQPTSPVAGQLYYSGVTNQVQYYDGTGYVKLQGGNVVTNNTYNNTNVTNTYGGGTTVNNFYSTPTNNTYVTNVTNVNGGSGNVSASSGSAGSIAMFTGSSTLGNSLISQNGSTLTLASNDDVLGANGGTPTAVTIQGGAASGVDVPGADVTFMGSNGTGVANGGGIIFETGQGASGGIRFDSSVETAPGTPGITSLSMSFTTGTENNRLLFVDTDCAASSMTYDGFALTKKGSATAPSSLGTGTYVELWYLLSPPSGTYPITANYVTSCNNGAGGHFNDGELGAVSYYNVNQANPFGTFATANGTQNGSGATNLTVTTINTSQIAVDAFGDDDNNYLHICTTSNSNQTVRWYSNSQFQKIECGSDLPGVVGQVHFNHTVSNTDWADVGVPVNAATAGSTPLVSPSSPIPDPMSDRLDITATGNIGIDNNDPQATLDVSGSARIQPSIDTHTAFQLQNASGTALLNVDTLTSTISISGTSSQFTILNLNNARLSSTQTTPPTTAGTPANCGSGTTAAVTTGSTDTAGSLTINAGTGSPTTCDTTVTFNQAYSTTPKSVILTPTQSVGGATSLLGAGVSNVTSSGFTVKVAPTNVSSGAVYSYYYLVVQ